MLTARQMLIFKCIVEEFIENAEPVGSKALMVKYQLPYSSATIRNEMNFLENYGYLEKTHISSGRVPSKEGYRFYVHNLGKVDLDEGTKNQVATIINKHRRNLNEMVHESCNMLSELTHLTSVALGNASDDMLQRISVVPLDDGRVTDSKGRTVDFKNTIIIMTSNAGAQAIIEPKKLGFAVSDDEKQNYDRMKNSVMEEVRRIFKPEFLNRIDETIVFRALNKDDMKQIVALMLKELTDRCEKQMGIHLTVRDSVKKHIVDKAYDPKYGARPLRRQIQNDIEDELAEEILSGKVKKDTEVVVTIHKEKVVFETK